MVLNKCLATAFVAFAVAVLASTGGCAGTTCDKAEKRVDACFPASKSDGGTDPATEDCSGAVECQANCYNQFDCSIITDFISGKATGKPLGDCLTECGSES